MTEEQHKAMRDLLRRLFVKKYLRDCSYRSSSGVSAQWCATDSPKPISGWRPGLASRPLGFELSIASTPMRGFAAGLGAPEYWKERQVITLKDISFRFIIQRLTEKRC